MHMARWQRMLTCFLVLTLAWGLLGSVAVKGEAQEVTDPWEMTIRENLAQWFGGAQLHKYVGNNRDYDWYIDQRYTGEYSNSNCGPASAAMVMKWKDEDFTGTAEDARNVYPAYGAWWRTNIIFRYFEAHGVEYVTVFLEKEMDTAIATLRAELEQGKIAILCVDMNYISRQEDPNQRTNRFYDYADGHFLVVKGYVEVDEHTYFEVYDPNSWGRTYADGQPMGKDRYYLAEELITAAHNWYQFAIVVQ
jgi:hypothetical protein